MTTVESVLKSDWFHSEHGDRLHFVEELAAPTDFWDKADDYCAVDTVAVCGRRARWVMPGVFSRMGLPRCLRCCAVAGINPGGGTPYNNPEQATA